MRLVLVSLLVAAFFSASGLPLVNALAKFCAALALALLDLAGFALCQSQSQHMMPMYL